MKHTEFLGKVKPEMVVYLQNASYHYADDSGKEWVLAAREMDKFVEKAFEYELTYYQLEEIIEAAAPLLATSAIYDAILLKGYRLEKAVKD